VHPTRIRPAAILNSPTWTGERSAIFLTRDEDAYGDGGTNQGNNVATLAIGSPNSGPRTGSYTSTTNHTHDSLLRTVENALSLPAMTRNDAYAVPMNDF